MTTHKVETATAADEAAVFAVLTLAFSSDPATRWTWPDPKAYLEAFPHFAKAFGGAAFGAGSAHRIGSAGAALWLPPGVGPDDAAIGALMQRTADAKTAVDGPQIMQQMARYHPKEPHWYLPLIGIDPAHQGKGLGGSPDEACDGNLRSRWRARLSRIVQPQERPALRAAWLRGPGHHPGRRVAHDHAHAAQTQEAMMLRGGCFCRTVRYEIDAEPTKQTICHCTMCRHAAGAPSVAWFSVPPDSVRFVAGEPQRFKSSEHATRSFCPDCGTTLTYQSTRTPGDLDVSTCSLDEPDQAAPRDHTFVRSKLSWVTIADGLPAYPTTRDREPNS